jgi:hypothetical protein
MGNLSALLPNATLKYQRNVNDVLLTEKTSFQFRQSLLLWAKKVGHKISVSFEKFDVVQALLSFFDTIPADSLKIDFILLFCFSKCPLLLIKVDFDRNFALNKYSLHSLQPTILNDVSQFKVGLQSYKGYFTLKVKTMTLMSYFFCPQ